MSTKEKKQTQTQWSFKPLPEDKENIDKIKAFIQKQTYGADLYDAQVIRAALKKWVQEIEKKS